MNKTIPNYDRIESTIVEKLFHYGCWGKGHLLTIRLNKGIPPEDVGHVDKVLKELIKNKIILIKKTKHGIATFLNHGNRRKIDEIRIRE